MQRWSEAPASRGTPQEASKGPEARRKPGKTALQTLEEARLCRRLYFPDFELPEL